MQIAPANNTLNIPVSSPPVAQFPPLSLPEISKMGFSSPSQLVPVSVNINININIGSANFQQNAGGIAEIADLLRRCFLSLRPKNH